MAMTCSVEECDRCTEPIGDKDIVLYDDYGGEYYHPACVTKADGVLVRLENDLSWTMAPWLGPAETFNARTGRWE